MAEDHGALYHRVVGQRTSVLHQERRNCGVEKPDHDRRSAKIQEVKDDESALSSVDLSSTTERLKNRIKEDDGNGIVGDSLAENNAKQFWLLSRVDKRYGRHYIR